jgi:hypothetical protein
MVGILQQSAFAQVGKGFWCLDRQKSKVSANYFVQ